MRSGSWSSRALRAVVGRAVVGCAVVGCTVVGGALVSFGPGTAEAAAPAGRSSDQQLAQAGVFVAGDLPAGFTAASDTGAGHADNLKRAKGVAGCAPYVTLEKAVLPLPQAKSPRFDDGSRTMGNEIDVFRDEKAATAALTLYAKPSIVACLEHLFEKQLRGDPSLDGKLADVVATLDRQDIAGIGDDSVVYEGRIDLSGTDGSAKQVGIGSAAVRVGRTVDVVTYTTDGGDLTEILTPAIDASVGRLRAVPAREAR